MSLSLRPHRRVFFPLAALCLSVACAVAQTTRVFTFPSSGEPISANLVQAPDGLLYGVTRQGGGSTNGYLFRLRPDGSDYQVVHLFTVAELGSTAGRPGNSLVFGADGVIYGTTEAGGSANNGTLYKINPDGSGFAILRSFTAGTTAATFAGDGGAPRGGLVYGADGILYGLTTRGTATPGATLNDSNGVLYRVAPDGSGYRVLFSFDQRLAATGGILPIALIQGRDGVLYGTVRAVGPTSVGGIFSIRTDGTGFTLLSAFSRATPANGLSPGTPVVHATDGFLYGTTIVGGARGAGSIFRMRTDGTGYQVIHSFITANQSNGYNPSDIFFQGRDGSLYGRTFEGGSFVNGEGDLYKIRTDGTGLRRLHSFNLGETVPVAFQASDGSLYVVGRVETGRTTVGNSTQITTADTIYRIVEAPGLEITQQPRSQTIAPGGIANFNVIAPGATTFQWRRNGTAIAGATLDRYAIVNVTAAASGTYTVVVGNGNAADSTTSADAVLLVTTPNPGRLINLSVRTNAGTGAQALIAGFVIGGAGSKQVLVRGIGPTLGAFGVPGVLADPQLSLFNATSAQLATNSGWGNTIQLNNAFAAVGAFPLGATARDAALLSTLPAGNYSAQVVSAAGATGVALIEAYDSDPAASTSRFINLSARTVAGTGAEALIAGFVLSGNVPKTLLIRGVGPGLNQFGVTGTLANPRLELRTVVNNVDTLVAANAGWAGSPTLANTFIQAGAFALPATSADAALLVTLTPGAYSAQVSGVGGTTGIALVEVFELP
ncbi:MAG: hypothetical protein JNK23_10910 [Opitutaceae bacterium]|nr:hypothetical protein [Opitutaceae bacterium]